MSDDGGEIPGGLAAYAKALQKGSKIAEPISDDELDEDLREWRQQIADYESHGDLRHLVFPGPCVARILARLDAAESRPSAEAVQAAVEALVANNEYLRDECIPDEQTDALTAVNNNAIAGLTGGEG